MSGPFTARYPGPCAHGDRIAPGETVVYDEDGDLVHVECPDERGEDDTPALDDKPGRNERYCPDCFTTHAGECL